MNGRVNGPFSIQGAVANCFRRGGPCDDVVKYWGMRRGKNVGDWQGSSGMKKVTDGGEYQVCCG